MELKDFIEQSISDIIGAVKNLKEKYNNCSQVFIDNETNPIAPNYPQLNIATQKNRAIEFDIAVTTSENGSAKASGKVGIKVLGGSLDGELQSKQENLSRIKFSIPFYPEYIEKEKK